MGGSITVTPDPVCIGDTITFTLSGVVDEGGIKRVDCNAKTEVPAVTPTYTWSLTIPADYPEPLPPLMGSGPAAGVAALVAGAYSCTFTASASRECAPDPITVGPATGTAATTATLTLDPSSIPAATEWPDMPAGLSQSDITVTWDPPDCEGMLVIMQVEGDDGYVPPGNGTLTRDNANLWRYDAFDEPAGELCPKMVTVSIAALAGNEELDRTTILVWPVHTWWATVQRDFQRDYNFLRWKYATVLATTGGAFTEPVTISEEPLFCGVLAYACTSGTDVVFATTTFSGSENQAASIIGHELVHTALGWWPGECPAYEWEMDHAQQTGIWFCDTTYLESVLQQLANPEICP